MKRNLLKFIVLALAVALLAALLIACEPVDTPYSDPYPIIEGPDNDANLDHTTKEQAIDKAVDSMENLLKHLDTEESSDTGYYVGANVIINTENNSAFRLNLKANLFTYPYEEKDSNGNVILGPDGLPQVNEEALAIHNDRIRYSDIILEWYDGATNEMLIGFYFDGINPNSADDGNDLYLNLQGSKRIFRDFGNSVLYQQLIRLITHFNLETLIGSASEGGTADSSFQSLRDALDMAVDNNYKQTINGNETTIFFDSVTLNTLVGDITDYMQSIFKPFEDKLDPLSNKYLGFLISTLGGTTFTSMTSDMQFRMEPNENLDNLDIMSALVLDVSGGTEVARYDKNGNETDRESIPFTSHIEANYSVRISSDITFDKLGYTEYDYGNYEYTGDMYIPMLDLELDVLLRTDVNEVDNSLNEVYMTCRDLATDDLMMGLYYDNELTYVDVEGIQNLYGGVQIEDLGLPKAYRGGFDLADTLKQMFDLIDTYIVIAVDNILYGQSTPEGEESKFSEITGVIIDNMESTMRDEADPSSRATIQIRVDFEMIRKILSLTSETGTEYSAEQLILLINNQFNIDIEAIASIAGVSVEELIETTYFYITYDVDYYSIRVEVYSTAEMTEEELEQNGAFLFMRLDLYPQHIGEYVRIVFPDFSDFNQFKEVMTYSGYLEGQFIFAATEEVDLSQLLGSFMGDESGLNTPFILPAAADIYFTLYYDQYIREQNLENGRWTRKSRSAFSLYLYMVVEDTVTPLAHVYANDVSLNTADPVEELGYVWLQYDCIEGMPRFKIREDHFIRGFYAYMGYDFEAEEDDDVVLGLTDIVGALMEDSWATFEPDVIRITTSNQTIKDFFRVDELIGTIAVQIGFTQRVKNIDQLEVTFAMYTVGNLSDIVGDSVYNVKLHDTVEVYFDFGNRVLTKDFYFLYDEASITVENDRVYYMPTTRNTFMGVTRDYNVHILSEDGRQRINALVKGEYPGVDADNPNFYIWEPLDPVPESALAYFGDDNNRKEYPADFNLHAVYDIPTGYYTVLNDEGYEVVYDLDNNVYVIGLGSNLGYDRVWKGLNEEIPYYYKEFRNVGKVDVMYEFGMRIPGWYVVTGRSDGARILYKHNSDDPTKNYYLVESAELREQLLGMNFGKYETEEKVESSNPNEVETEIVVHNATIYTYTIRIGAHTFYFDPVSGYYVRNFVETVTDESGAVTGTVMHRAAIFNPGGVYDLDRIDDMLIMVNSMADETYLRDVCGYTGGQVYFNEGVNWDSAEFAGIDWESYDVDDIAAEDTRLGQVDWEDDIFSSLTWSSMTWDDVTINGGIYVVYVVIGEGMMATYRQNVRVKITNREIDTDRYVNINTEDGKVTAPVADYIQVDPYLYLLYRAYYENTLSKNMTAQELAEGFAAWYLEHYTVTFNFTQIYADSAVPEEDTLPETGAFMWYFDFVDGNEIYSESNIDNRHTGVQAGSDDFAPEFTYVYTVFHNQVIALGIEILPRELVAVYFEGEEETNTYTVDALDPDTFVIPADIIYIFREKTVDGGYKYYVFNPLNYEYAYVYGDAEQIYAEQRDKLAAILGIEESALNSLFVTLRDEGIDFSGDPLGGIAALAGSGAAPIIQWVNPVADVVYLVGNDGNPFAGYEGNVTTSYAGFANYFDHARKWYHVVRNADGTIVSEWFRTELVTITVNVPDKVVGTRSYDAHETTFDAGAVGDDETALDVMNVVPDGGSWEDRGVFFVDPYDKSTWSLGTGITVYFDDGADTAGNPLYFARRYDVTWIFEGQEHYTGVAFENAVAEAAGAARYYILTAVIGSGEQTMEISLLVQFRSAYMNEVTFMTAAEGGYAELVNKSAVPDDAPPYGDGHMVESVWPDGDHSKFQLPYYVYYVDTYYRFDIPVRVRIAFSDSSVREYDLIWNEHLPWAPGDPLTGTDNTVVATAPLGDGIESLMRLDFSVEAKSVLNMVIAPVDETLAQAGITFGIDYNEKRITVNIPQGRVYIIRDPSVYNNAIGVVGVYDDLGMLIKTYAPYDFFMALFDNIVVEFTDISLPEIVIADAATSAENYIMSTFDTQKVADGGQNIDIYIGQDNDADDYTVFLNIPYMQDARNYIEFADEQYTDVGGTVAWSDALNAVVMDFTLETYTSDNLPAYPDGYDIAADLPAFYLKRGNGDEPPVLYGGSGAALPAVWYVEAPAAYNDDNDYAESYWADSNEANRMYGFERYDSLSVIPWNELALGGKIWLTAMFGDNSRIYVSINVPSVEIGREFHSVPGDTSMFTIIGGVITISDYYNRSYYPLTETLNANNLPKSIAIGKNYGDAGNIVRTNVKWEMTASGVAAIRQLTYKGTGGEIEIANATVAGKKISLYLNVLDATVKKISLLTDYAVVGAMDFVSEWISSEGVIVINIDPYVQTGYEGVFTMPTGSNALTFAYGEESAPEEYLYAWLLDEAYSESIRFAYSYAGEGDREFTMSLLGGQQIKVRINFLDKTVTGINADNDSSVRDDMLLLIDPYNPDISVHDTVTLKFAEGEDIEYTFDWSYAGFFATEGLTEGDITVPFEVMYDTYRRVLLSDSGDEGYFGFADSVQFNGIDPQPLTYIVKVMDRLMETYKLRAEQNLDSYADRLSPKASYVFDDPFTGRASDIPSKITGWNAENEEFTDLDIIWDFANADITADGTSELDGGYMLVSGHVYDAERGQPVYIKIYIETWSFEAIRRPVGTEYQIMTGDSLRFVVSSITDLLATDHFEVAFSVTELDVNPQTGVLSGTSAVSVRIPFVSEGIDPTSVDYFGSNETYREGLESGHQYVLYVDDEAVAEARRNGSSVGNFYLGNASAGIGDVYRENIIPRTPQAYYEYERPTITQINLGFGFGTPNNAIYVANPLNPEFGTSDGMTVGAIGTYNSEYERLLTGSPEEGGAGFTATLNWINTGVSATYLGGGVVRNWTVRITLTKDSDFSYEQEFAIMMVFLDMSPLDYISGDAGNVLISNVRTVYNESSYINEYNPYTDVYMRDLVGNIDPESGKNVLEIAVERLGVRDKRITYNVKTWDDRFYTSQGVNTRYSSEVTIFGNDYLTDIVERRWSVSGYRISDFKLNYNILIDGAEKQLLILNPLEPGAYEIVPSAVEAENIPDGATYRLVWWDAYTQGAFVANSDWLGGGIITDWIARILVSDTSGQVIYAETVSIAVAFLDVLPSGRVITSALGASANPPKYEYTETTYSDADNPYGVYYNAVNAENESRFYEMLTQRAYSSDVNMSNKQYYYLITEWGEDGASLGVEVYAGNNTSGTYIGKYATDAFSRG